MAGGMRVEGSGELGVDLVGRRRRTRLEGTEKDERFGRESAARERSERERRERERETRGYEPLALHTQQIHWAVELGRERTWLVEGDVGGWQEHGCD